MTKQHQTTTPSPGAKAKKLWGFLQKFPKGNSLFSMLAGLYVPYTGSISPTVMTLEDGHVIVKLRDKRKVRNHLKSIHALALANLGEFTTGLTLITMLEQNSNAILRNLNIEYLKKARGTLIAEATYMLPQITVGDTLHLITANIKNDNNEIVCVVTATWSVRTVLK